MKKLNSSFSRRLFAQGLATGGLTALMGGLQTAGALAAPVDPFPAQAEWEQKYDADAALQVRRTITPLLSQQTVVMTDAAIAQYRELVARGGWQGVPAGQTLKVGSNGASVVALRKRLMVTGDLDVAVGFSPIFDSYVQAAVRRFQARHGINATGVVAVQTFQALNVPAQDRLRQLELNLVRLRSFAANLGPRFITMNIPAAAVETIENGMVFSHHAAGVGKIDRQSPVMQAKVVEINFNPFWTVPASIIRKDLIPKMQADPKYLTDNHIRVYDHGGQEVQPARINWRSDEATRYVFRQDTGGEFNSLGFVRINIANPYGVYMHDTPAKGIFGDDFRFVSSGCMRLQNVRDYVTWLLKDTPGWTRDRIDEVIASGQRVDARLTQTVPVYWIYITAWATPEGTMEFRDDIYNKDGLGAVPVAAAISDQD